MRPRASLTLLLVMVVATIGCATASRAPAPRDSPAQGDWWYHGLRPPTTPQPFTPTIFAELGVLFPTNLAYSPDGRRLVFTAVNAEIPRHVVAVLFESRFDGTRWSRPAYVRAVHQPGHNNAEPVFSPDGRWLYFTSTRPPGELPWYGKLFRAAVTDSGYGPTEMVTLDIPAAAEIAYPQFDHAGNLLFTSTRIPGRGEGDLFVARRRADGESGRPTLVEGDFNTERHDWDLVESPDGRLRLWASMRAGGAGRVDIYASRLTDDGRWSPARNVTAINTPAVETAPRLSPDGHVLFFQRQRADGKEELWWVRAEAVIPET